MLLRKEVRLGLAIGGVLLAVIIVYLLVVTARSDKPQQVTLDTSSGSGDQTQGQTTPPRQENRPETPPVRDPFEATSKPVAADTGQGTQTASGDRWSTILTTGEVPLMLTETPTGTGSSPPAPGAGSLGSTGSTSSGSGGPMTLSTSGGGSIGSAAPGAGSVGTSIGPTNSGTGNSGSLGTGSSGAAGGAPPIAEANQPANTGGTQTVPIAANTGGAIPPHLSEPPPAGSPRTHVVRSGETYASIAAAAYGNASYFPHLIRANPTIEARKLRPGMTINIPPVSEVKVTDTPRPAGAAQSAQQTPLDPKTEYRVTDGDNLERISIKLYGKRDRTEKLYELNKSTIGSDPAKLKIGMVLKLPEAPTTAR